MRYPGWFALLVTFITPSIVLSSSERVVEPLCYQCYYEKYLDLESGDSNCRHPTESSTKTEPCPSSSCAKRIVNSNQHYQVQRYCLTNCRQVEFQYQEIKGEVHCCVGHLCNHQTHMRYDIKTITLFGILSMFSYLYTL